MKPSLRSWLLVTLLTVSVAGSQSFAEVNMLANPSFEDNGGSYDGWFTFGSGPQISTPGGDNIIRTGMAAAKIFGEFTGCPGSPQFDVGGFGQGFTPVAGMAYELRGFSFVSSGDPIPGTDTCNRNRLLAQIAFFDAPVEGSVISTNEVVIGDGNFPTDVWRPFVAVSAPAPAGAQRVEAIFLFLQPECDQGAVYVDDTSFCEVTPAAEPNLLANPSFDLDLTGWSTFGNVFHNVDRRTFRTPTGSAKLFSTFEPETDSGMFQTFTAGPGSAWKLDVYSLNTCAADPISEGNDNIGIARVVFRDMANAEIGSTETVILEDDPRSLGHWTRHTVLALDAPEGTVAVEPFILFVSPSLLNGAMWIDDVSFQQLDPVGVGDRPAPSPVAFELSQNVPNPFNPATRIDFVLTQPSRVDLSIYDLAGRQIVSLLREQLESGSHSVTWNGRTASGAPAAAGVYHYVLDDGQGRISRSMSLVK
jgi:hypothetical protein